MIQGTEKIACLTLALKNHANEQSMLIDSAKTVLFIFTIKKETNMNHSSRSNFHLKNE